MEQHAQDLKVLGQSSIALLLGGIIGWERESAGKWAGLRTHMLVCLGSMLFVRIGVFLVQEVQETSLAKTLQTDPVRIIEAIVTGIAFIGAGTIFRDQHRQTAHGLTTAASLLTVAPIGVAVAIERYVLAVGVTLIVVFILHVIGRMEHHQQAVIIQTKDLRQ